VIVDSTPRAAMQSSSREEQSRRHQLAADFVESDLRAAGFEIVERNNKFVSQENGGSRWMIVARKTN